VNGPFDPLAGFAPGRLLEDPRTVESPIYLVLLSIFVVAFIAGLIMSLNPERLAGRNRIHRRLLQHYGALIGWIGLIGMIVIGLRYLNVPLFSKPLWTFLNFLALLAVIAHFVRYRLRFYPAEMAAYREEERRRRFVTPGARRRRR
jgi:hypothetical protein